MLAVKQIVSVLVIAFLINTLIECNGLDKAVSNLEEGYTLEENDDILDGINDEALAYINKGYIIYDETDTLVASITKFNARKDLIEFVECFGTEQELEELEDNFSCELLIIADEAMVNIMIDQARMHDKS